MAHAARKVSQMAQVHPYFSIWSELREGGSSARAGFKKSGWRRWRETGSHR